MPNIRLPFTNVRVVGHVPESLRKLTANQSANQPAEENRNTAQKPYQKDISLGFVKFRKINPKFVNSQGETALHLAAEKGDLVAIKHLLKNERVEVNIQDRHGNTALHRAAMSGHRDVVLALLSNEKSDPGLKNAQGNTALHLAVRRKHTEIARKLLEDNRLDPNQKNNEGATPLHIATDSTDNSENVELLLSSTRVDPNSEDNFGRTPLHNAAFKGDLKNVELLLKNALSDPGRMINHAGGTPLHSAMGGFTNLKIVQMLLQDGRIDPNHTDEMGNPAILCGFSTSLDQRKIINMMLEDDRVNPGLANKSGETLLFRMARCKDGEIVQKLLADDRVDPNGMLWLIKESPAVAVDMFKSAIPNLASHSTEADSLIKVLEYMADFKPGNAAPNRILTARTNFHLGKVLAEADNFERKGECAKDAVFRFTLALEQLRNHAENGAIDINEYAKYAKALLEAAPDAKQFNLGGLPVLRSDIEDIAEMRGTEMMNLKLQQNIHHNQQVHMEGFLLRGQELLKAIQDRNAIHIKQSAENGLKLALEKNVPLQLGSLNTDTETVIREMWTYIQNENEESKQGSIDSFLNRLMKAEKEKLSMEQVAKELLGTSIEIKGMSHNQVMKLDAAQLLDIIRGANQSHTRKSIQQIRDEVTETIKGRFQERNANYGTKSIDQVQMEIREAISDWGETEQGALVEKAMTHALVGREGNVDEDGLKTDVRAVMREMWGYVRHQPEDLKKQLTAAFLARLVDIGRELPCNMGIVQRILDTPAGIDFSLTHNQPDPKMIKEEIQTMAGQMNNDFEEGLREYYPSSPSQASSSQDDDKSNDDGIVAEVKKDLLSAAVMERLVRQRGWDPKTVEEQLQPVLDSIKYL